MRLAAIQHETASGTDEMARLLETAKEALESGADFLFLPERPLPALTARDSERFADSLESQSQQADAVIVGCDLHEGIWPDGSEYVPVFRREGDIVRLPVRLERFVDTGRLPTATTSLGEIAVLSSVDCFASNVLVAEGGAVPRALVMQVSAASALEREAIRELALRRSEAQVSLVVVTSLTGQEDLCGGAAIMFQGEVLGEAGDGQDVVIADVEPGDFVDLALLRHPVQVPELLRQKIEHL